MPESPPFNASKKNPLGSILILIAAIALYGAFVAYRWQSRSMTTGEQHPAVGSELPVIDLQPLVGASRQMRETDLVGKVVLMNLWATWCPPCRAEFPRLADLHERLQGEPGFVFLSVSCEQPDDTREELLRSTTSFLKTIERELPVYMDSDHQTRQSVALVLGEGSLGLPTTVVMDRAGIIRGVWVGYLHGDEVAIESLIRSLLDESKESAPRS